MVEKTEIGVEVGRVAHILADNAPSRQLLSAEHIPGRELHSAAGLVEAEGIADIGRTDLEYRDIPQDIAPAIAAYRKLLGEFRPIEDRSVVAHRHRFEIGVALKFAEFEAVEAVVVGVIRAINDLVIDRNRRHKSPTDYIGQLLDLAIFHVIAVYVKYSPLVRSE